MTENEAIKMLENILIDYKNLKNAILCQQMVDLAVKALREVQEYREMDRKLRKCFGDCDGLLKAVVDGICEHAGIDIGKPIKARLLTDEDVDKWDTYREIGTVEECREAREKQNQKPLDFYGDSEDGKLLCPNCGNDLWELKECGFNNCPYCGQVIQWNENLEGMEDGTGQV